MKYYFFIFLITLFFTSCGGSNKIVKPLTKNSIKTEQSKELNLLQKNGVDYFAEGASPTPWKLSINNEDTVYFSSNDGLKLAIGYNYFSKNESENNIVYNAKIKSGDISITIIKNACKTTLNDKVTFQFNTKYFEGCGGFLKNSTLNANWELYKIDNQILNLSDYKGLPTLMIGKYDNSLTGFDGCTKFDGFAEIQGDRISFSKINYKSSNCNKKSIKEIIDTKINNRIVYYFFRNNDLVLYLIDDSMLTFRKIK